METQEILDTDLEQASKSVRERFWLLLEGPEDGDLATVSATRTAGATALPRWHVPDEAGTAALKEFVASDSRVFVLCGPAGTGKSTLVQSTIASLAGTADVQMHPGAEASATDLAAAVLRYGSVPVG
ncbi:hypothetical protein [Myceligenerans indicum]|uniref:AAA family ATPase n=1 Tax=Myceligenerans indicum TaxID=2593663 RepID=A0ABS1LM96_9MICO|nr:hypothetical protein [Myceligenerans indicum]MBL0886908.1 hypothetical protein [Myceligenerans indicum]